MGHERCDACGFDGADWDDGELLVALRALGPAWDALLSDAGPELRVRPAPATWSAIEYAAHSRDITALHVYGVEQALTGEEPVLPGIEADVLIESAAATYADADPVTVVSALGNHAGRLADLAAGAGPGSWGRGITIGTSRSDVRQLLEHALHDARHHLDDVARGLSALRGAGA
jgi:S-DNA-T family DNA segregation ATPase FtsK/SpoIIIE